MRLVLPVVAIALSIPQATSAEELVRVPAFRSVQLQGGADLYIMPGPVQRVAILAGNAQSMNFHVVRDGRLEIEACNENCPPNHHVRIGIESPSVPDVVAEFGATISVRPGFGPQRQLSAAVDAGGTLDLRSVEVDHVSVAVNAGGDIHVSPRSTLSAAIKYGGEIYYTGHPQVSTAITDGGTVEREPRRAKVRADDGEAAADR